MAGRPFARGRGRRLRQRTASADRRRGEHVGRWAAAQTPAQRLWVLAETARSLTAGRDRYGDHAEINALLERSAAELHRQLRGVLERRTRR